MKIFGFREVKLLPFMVLFYALVCQSNLKDPSIHCPDFAHTFQTHLYSHPTKFLAIFCEFLTFRRARRPHISV